MKIIQKPIFSHGFFNDFSRPVGIKINEKSKKIEARVLWNALKTVRDEQDWLGLPYKWLWGGKTRTQKANSANGGGQSGGVGPK